VGISSAAVILANKLSAWAMDRYVAKTSVEGQQGEDPVRPDRRDNLFAPVPGNFAAEGVFGSEAYGKSIQLHGAIHRNWIALGIGGLALLSLYWKTRN
jgi:hypothetical protein